MVRKRQCRRCGGFKTTPPLTSYIYCDFCGLLFDIDAMVAAQDPAALDPDTVSGALSAVTDADLMKAFRADDRESYASLVRWKTELDMDVSPETYSPRIGDPGYRAILVDVLVDWAVALQWDPDFVTQSSALEESEMTVLAAAGWLNAWTAEREVQDETGARSGGTLDVSDGGRRKLEVQMLEATVAHLEASKALWRRELEILSAAGIAQRHPDELDESMWLAIHSAQFCRRWLPFLTQPADIEALLEATGTQALYVEAPHPDLTHLTCGQCDSKVKAPKGAKQKMCEACGYVLDLEKRTMACTTCGAGLALAYQRTDQTTFHCAYCDGHWSL
jgi:hypothetical protein